MKAVGYIRVSTEDQAKEGISLEAQQHKIKAWCESKGIPLHKIYADAGISGFKMKNRPEVNEAVKAANKGDVLVVYSLSRFSRSVIECLTELENFEKRGVDFVSLSENIDTTTAMGKAFSGVLAIFNQLFRDQIAEATRTALSHKRAKMEKTGGDVPYGYTLVENGRLVANEGEQKAISLMVELRDKGYSLRAIAHELEKEGHKTKTGKTAWNPKTVSAVIKRAVNE